jgi:hypothetical protein
MIGKVVLGTGIALIALFSFTFIVPSFAATGQSYAAYKVTATGPTNTVSAVVNETISPSSITGHSDLTLQLTSSKTNFTISRLINSTFAMLPVLPTIGNQSFSYDLHNYTISVSLVKTGTGTATISGNSYTVTNYSFQVSGSKTGGTSGSASGNLSVLPSGLVYTALVNAKNYTVQAQLLSTNAALGASASSSTSAPVVIGGSVGMVAAGVGAFALYRRKGANRSESKQDESKPLYHVD